MDEAETGLNSRLLHGPPSHHHQLQAAAVPTEADGPPCQLPPLASTPSVQPEYEGHGIQPGVGNQQTMSSESLAAGLELHLYHAAGGVRVPGKQLQALRTGSHLYNSPRFDSALEEVTITYLPPELRSGILFTPSDIDDHITPVSSVQCRGRVGAHAYARVYVLWPSCMEHVPLWLRNSYELLEPHTSGRGRTPPQPGLGGVVHCHWHAHFMAQLMLVVTQQRREYFAQTLLVYRSQHILPPNSTFTLYGAGAVGEPTDVPYIIAFQLAQTPDELSTSTPAHSKLTAAPGSLGLGHNLRPRMDMCCDGMDRGSHASHVSAADASTATASTLTPKLISRYKSARKSAAATGPQSMGALSQVEAALFQSSPTEAWRGDLPVLGLDNKLNFDDLPQILLQLRDLEQLKVWLLVNMMAGVLKSRKLYLELEQLAILRKDPELLLILQYKSSQELSARALGFLLNCMWSMARRMQPCGLWINDGQGTRRHVGTARKPRKIAIDSTEDAVSFQGVSMADEMQAFLVTYTIRRRNPLSTTAAILRGIAAEIVAYEECKLFMRASMIRFKSLHYALLKQVGRKDSRTGRPLSLMQSVLDPTPTITTGRKLTINDTSPMQAALDSLDLRFMSSPFVGNYIRATWNGEAYAAQTLCADKASNSLLSNFVAWRVLKALGFAGGPADVLIQQAMRVWHLYAVTSVAFFNSPRGRWACHAMAEASFLVLFQLVVFWPDERYTPVILIIFLVMVVGNLLEIIEHVNSKYGSPYRIKRWLVDPWNVLNLGTNAGLLVLTALLLVRVYQPRGSVFEDGYQQGEPLQLAICTMAVPVWVRGLGMVIPVYPSLGPLLITVGRMMGELLAFLFPLFVVIAGFSTMLVGVYKERVLSYGNFGLGLLTMFKSMLGGYSYDDFSTDADGNALPVEQTVYGSIALSVYLVIAAILLMNLLIAIITNRYNPDDLEAEMQLKRANIVDYYARQARDHRICSPFNVPHACLRWLPTPVRPRLLMAASHRFGLLPLDGPDTPADKKWELRGGRAEFPHLVYLITLYPFLMVLANAAFYLYTPFAMLRFATKTFKRLIKLQFGSNKIVPEESTHDGSHHPTKQPDNNHNSLKAAPAAVAEACRHQKCMAGSSVTATGSQHCMHVGGPMAESLEAGLLSQHFSAKVDKMYRGVSQAIEAQAHHAGALFASADNRLERLERKLMGKAKAGVEAGELCAHNTMYWLVVWVLLAAGAVVYVLLLGVFVITLWTSLYLWAAKLLFSLFNLFLLPLEHAWGRAKHSPRTATKQAAAGVDRSSPNKAGPFASRDTAAHTAQKSAATRARWRAATTKVIQLHVSMASNYLMPHELSQALALSRFARLLPKWGLKDLLGYQEQKAHDTSEDSAGRMDDDDPSDEEEADDQNSSIMDALQEVAEQQSEIAQAVARINQRLDAIAGSNNSAATAE